MYTHTHTHTHTKRDYYSTIAKNEIMPFVATWMDLEMIILSKSEKDKYHMISLICGILKMIQTNLYTKQKKESQAEKTNLWLSKWRGWGIN